MQMASDSLLLEEKGYSYWERVKNKWSNLCLKLYPSGFKNEFKLLFSIYVPVVFMNLFRFINPIISSIVCGHLTKIDFDAVALASSIINILGISIDMGFASAFDTLFAQYHGANEKKKMGALLQRAMFLMTILYLGLTFIHLNIEPVLIFLKQDPLIAELCTKYLTLYLPGLFFDFQFLIISRYLQNQNYVYPSTISAFMTCIFNIVLQPIFVHVLGYGLEASAVIQGLGCLFGFAIQLGYILISKIYEETWPGFSWKACFEHWKIILMLGIPGIFMMSVEEWNYEIAAFVAGAIDSVQLGVQSIAFQVATIQFMCSMGLSISMTIKAGQYLGMNDLSRFRTSFATGVTIGAIVNTTIAIIVLSFRHIIPKIFTNDPDILKGGEKILLVVAFFEFSDLLAVITQSLIRATGRQGIGAITMFITYYGIGIPIGLVLVLVVKTNIWGMWIGLIIGSVLQGILLSIILSRINWKNECHKINENVRGPAKTEIQCDESSAIYQPIRDSKNVEIDKKPENDHSIHQQPISLESVPSIVNRRSFSISSRFTSSQEYLVEMEADSDELPDNAPFTSVFKVSHFFLISATVLLFISGILLRNLLPKLSYLPCIPRTNFSVPLYHNYPQFLCNSTINYSSMLDPS